MEGIDTKTDGLHAAYDDNDDRPGIEMRVPRTETEIHTTYT